MENEETKKEEAPDYDWRKEARAIPYHEPMTDIPVRPTAPSIPYAPAYGVRYRTKTDQELRQECLEAANMSREAGTSAESVVYTANKFYMFIKEGLVP